MTDIALPDARTLAAAILDAWRSHNLPVLRRRLDSVAQNGLIPPADTAESERLELVEAIAGTMRAMLESGEIRSVDHCLPLLRHLAAAPARILDYAYGC